MTARSRLRVPARSGTTRRARRTASANDAQPDRARRAGSAPRRDGFITGVALLQGRRQHRHARRPPVDERRHAARGRRPSPSETASGWQEVAFAHTGRGDGGHDLRRLVPHDHRPLRVRLVLLRDRLTTIRRCTRSPTATTAANGVYRYGGPAFPDQTFNSSQLLGRRRLRRRRRPRRSTASSPTASCHPMPAFATTAPIEVGAKFRSSVAGEIRALRFYKGAANTGTHVGHLWTRDGALARRAGVRRRDRVGLAGSRARHARADRGQHDLRRVLPLARLGTTRSRAAGSRVAIDAPPLRLLADGEDGGNAVYLYGGGVPRQQRGRLQLLRRCRVRSWSAGRRHAADRHGGLAGERSDERRRECERHGHVQRGDRSREPDGRELRAARRRERVVSASLTYAAATRTATLDPSANLAYSSVYTARVAGGAGGVTDAPENPLAADFVWSFTTQGPPPPRPRGRTRRTDPGGRGRGESVRPLLRRDPARGGLERIRRIDASALDAGVLATHEIVVLGEMALAPAQVTLLADWVAGGGKLVAMRPDKQLAALLGLVDENQTLANAYLAIDGSSGPGRGAGERHPPVPRRRGPLLGRPGQRRSRHSIQTAATATPYPAVTRRSVGANGGQAASWSFDLARSVVLTRQGNPAWAGTERDGVTPIRSDDQFFGAAAGDPQPDWVDLTRSRSRRRTSSSDSSPS